MLQGGSVFRYQPVDQQITARTVAAPATHRPIDLFLRMLSRSLPTQRLREENSQIRLRIDVTKWDGQGKLSKATRIVQHCGSTTKRSSEIKKQPSGYCFVMAMPVCQKPDKAFFSNLSAATRSTLCSRRRQPQSATSDRTSKVRSTFKDHEILAEKEGQALLQQRCGTLGEVKVALPGGFGATYVGVSRRRRHKQEHLSKLL